MQNPMPIAMAAKGRRHKWQIIQWGREKRGNRFFPSSGGPNPVRKSKSHPSSKQNAFFVCAKNFHHSNNQHRECNP
jgi:hypothetical protein